MFLLSEKRLTHEADIQIMKYVKLKNPKGYFLFSSTFIAINILSIVAFAEILAYLFLYAALYFAKHVDVPELEAALNVFIQVVIATVLLLLILSILNRKFYRDLQSHVKDGARNII